VAFSLTALSLSCRLCAQTGAHCQSETPLAFLAGEAIYEDQFPAASRTQLERIRYQEFELKRKALDEVLAQKLLESEAMKKRTSVEKLLEMEVDAKVIDPTLAEVEAYCQTEKEHIGQPFDRAQCKLKETLRQSRIQAARETYFKLLRQQADIEMFLRPPRVEVNYDRARLRGSRDARITIVEFSDFHCPFCMQVETTLKEVIAKYQGKVNLAFRDFPLRDIHPQAQLAAEASRCAVEQGKFWEYHDLLFENQDRHSRQDLLKNARMLKLDEKRFISCLDSGKYGPQIEQDIQDAVAAGVSGTPSFFINGVLLAGAKPAAEFEKIISEELQSANRETVQK